MTLPDLYESSRSKAAQQHRRRLAPKILDRIRAAGAHVVVLDKIGWHCRMTLTSGLQIDLWVTTLKWVEVGGNGLKGDGMVDLLKVIASPPPAPPIRDKASVGLVNIFADASFNHRTGEGGWGAVLASPSGEWKEVSGVLENCPTSSEAEVRAMANGLESALTRNMLAPGGIVMIQSDCAGALSILLGVIPGALYSKGVSDLDVRPARRLHVNMRASEGVAQITHLVTTHRLKLMLRHNRGHAGSTNRGKISQRADRLANSARKEKA